ncbi:MAG: DsrE family protein [Syntrophobacteraceae bacterium]|nr:DsrE family protein [Syntrophobacteraceae bacterium]
MSCKVVFHLDWNDRDRMNMALNNIFNLLKDPFGQNCVVRVLANGQAVKLFEKSSTPSLAEKISELRGKGVGFLLCNNSLTGLGIGQGDLVEGCEVVPAGIVELIRLQQQGFAYVKP